MSRIIIFVNGELPDLEAARALLKEDDYLIAADGGANHLMKMDILPDVLIGDLDSVDEDTLFELTSADIKIEQYPEDKDETDLELALRYAIESRPSAILIVGALGGRLVAHGVVPWFWPGAGVPTVNTTSSKPSARIRLPT